MKVKYSARSTEWIKIFTRKTPRSVVVEIDGKEVDITGVGAFDIKPGEYDVKATINYGYDQDVIEERRTIPNKEKGIISIVAKNKMDRSTNKLMNPYVFIFVILGALLALVSPPVGTVVMFLGLAMFAIKPSTYVYKKKGTDTFQIWIG